MLETLGQRVLWQRARDYLQRYQPSVVGIAGTAGTSLVGAALVVALGKKRRIRTAPLQYQGKRSVPLAILGISKEKARATWMRLLIGSRIKELAEEEPSIIALELGADKPGDIDFFARILPLKVVVVTGIQSANLHLFNNLDLLAHEHASLVAAVPRDGVVCLNKDDPRVEAMADKAKAKVIWFGEQGGCDVQLVRAHQRPKRGYAAEFRINGTPHEIHLPHIVARHQLTHIAAALAAAIAVGVKPKEINTNFMSLKPPAGTMRLITGKNDTEVLDYSIGATPESLLAALNGFASMPPKKEQQQCRRFAILGDFEELGSKSVEWHQALGKKAAEVADVFVAVGEHMRSAGATALRTDDTDVHHFNTSSDVGHWLTPHLKPGDIILIAGGSEAGMQVVVKHLAAHPESIA